VYGDVLHDGHGLGEATSLVRRLCLCRRRVPGA
jgi:hypothetical protein